MSKLKMRCPLAFALDEVGDKWTFLILRNAFFGERNFNGFVGRLGIARNILTARLEKMVLNGLFVVQTTEDGREREYHLTDKAKDLAGPIVALRLWAERWNPNLEFDGVAVQKGTAEKIEKIVFKTVKGKVIDSNLVRIDPGLVQLTSTPKKRKERQK